MGHLNHEPKSNFRRTADWLTACSKLPDGNTASLQIGCHLEEVTELLDTISIIDTTGISHATLQEVSAVLKAVATNLKAGHAKAVIFDHEAALDALSDAEVTGNGVAFLMGYNKEGHDAQVLDKNDDKMNPDGTPVIKPGGKIGKREGWTPPDAAPFVVNAITVDAT